MAFDIKQYHGQYNIQKRTQPIKFIVCHYTGAGTSKAGSALANCKYFAGGNRNASAHYFIDDQDIYEYANPRTLFTWHVGDGHGRYGITNSNSIGIEVCSGGADFTQAEQERLRFLVTFLMQQFAVDAAHVVRHYDASRKACPYPYVPNGGDPSGSKWATLHAYITGGSNQQAPASVTVQPVQPAPQPSGIAVDGWIGPASVTKWQQVMGTYVDGVISGQYAGNKKYLYRINSIQYTGGGNSALVRAVQRAVGVTADGYLGPNTVRAIQAHLGVSVDGYFGPATAMALQKRLNENRF